MGRGSSKGNRFAGSDRDKWLKGVAQKYGEKRAKLASERIEAAKAMQNAERNYNRQETMYNHASIVRPNDPETAKIKARYDKAAAKYEAARKRFAELDERLTKMEMARIKAESRNSEEDDIPF